ncbi:MAG TPA: hypothetical protein VF092_13345 [Longimicrobium sp.]
MSDDVVDDPPARTSAFLDYMALSANDYPDKLDGAVAHATAAGAAAPPAHHWVPIGPRSVGGRVRSLAQHPNQPLRLYAGSATGGLWRSTDGGDTWAPGGDPAHALPVGAIGVSAQHPEVVYAGTGDPVAHKPGGRGLFRFDFGAGPAPVPLRMAAHGITARYTAIAVDPDDGNRFWGASPDGLWRFQFVAPVGAAAHAPPTREFPAAAMAGPPAGEPALAAANVPALGADDYATDVLVVHDTRSAATVNLGFGAVPQYLLLYVGIWGEGVFRGRLDRGVAAPFPMEWRAKLPVPTPGSFGRVLLAACRKHPEHVYAVVGTGDDNKTASEVYHSSDRGDTWKKRGKLPESSQANYSMVLFVHPENPAVVVHGTVDLYYSSDSGESWKRMLDWEDYDRGDRARHADQQWGFFDRFDPYRIWIANDGGISAADTRRPPASRGFWRKRSHGIAAAQFQDVTVHPSLRFITGGGLHDNGSYVSYGGDSWYHVGGGDGGAVAFEPNDPRRYYFAAAMTPGGRIYRGDVGTAHQKVPGSSKVSYVMPEAPVASGVYKILLKTINPDAEAKGLFYGIQTHHPTLAGHMLAGRKGAAWLTTNSGDDWRKMKTGDFHPDDALVASLAYAPNAAGEEWWIGTNRGEVFRTANGSVASGANPTDPTWNDMTSRNAPAVGAAGPGNPRWGRRPVRGIDFDATRNRDAAGRPGRAAIAVDENVWLWDDGWLGDGWIDITGAGATGLPSSPITAVVFDPLDRNVLYAGTLAGVYVLMSPLPPVPAPPPPGPGGAKPAAPAFVPRWAPFHVGMPIVVVTDLQVIPDPLSPAAGPAQSLLRAATWGRGMFECHLPPTPDASWQTLLYVRQYSIDDGLHPRQAPAALNAAPLNGDPRAPAGQLPFDLFSGYDIRVDAPPYTWLEDTVDPVEFDEDLPTDPLVVGEVNFVYVQVHNRGWDTAAATQVHLFFAPVPVPAPGADPAVPQLPAWAGFPADPVPAPWVRVGAAALAVDLRPGEPRVVRFDFIPPASVAGQRVALLAVASRAGDVPSPIGAATGVDAFLTGERRASLRVVSAGDFFPVYVRDGVEDSGHSGDVAWGGRSPDIIIIPPAGPVPGDPHAAFANRADPRADDKLKGGGDNTLFVRVFNPSRLDVDVEVELFQAVADDDGFKQAQWTAVTPVTPVAGRATHSALHVAAQDHALAPFRFNPPDPDAGGDPAYKAYLLVALVHHPANSPLPDPAGVDAVPKFWELVRSSLAAKRAALRAVRWEA